MALQSAVPVSTSTQSVSADAQLRSGPEQRHPIEFTANGRDYFRIWIVNIALTVLTLGIYSAWAKVRKRRYFYANTRVAGEGFEYRARPIAILKGRLIAVALLATFYGVGIVSPEAQLLLFIPLVIAVPWLIVRSLAFNAHYTAYRNIRFRFSGSYGGLIKIILTYGWLVFLGILYPYFKRRLVRFIADNHGFGATPFALDDSFARKFIDPYVRAYLAGFLVIVAFIGAMVASGVSFRGGAVEDAKATAAGAAAIGFVVLYAGFFVIWTYLRARTINALWGSLVVGPVRIESTLRARGLMWIYVSNLLLIAFTLGIATPWATVRAKRYRAACTSVLCSATLDGFLQAEGRQVGAAGEEAADLFDVDIAL